MSESSRHSRQTLRHRRPRATGMTLLELLVVMAILAMLSGLFPLAIQRLMPARRLAMEVRSLTINLRELQSQAALSGRPLQLDMELSGYSLQRASDFKVTHIHVPSNVHVTLKAAENTQPTRALVMYPDGSSSGGAFELRLDRRLAKVTVSGLTGRVHVSR